MRGIKDAFGEFDQQSMFLEALKYPLSVLMMEGHIVLGVDSQIVHVNLQPFLP